MKYYLRKIIIVLIMLLVIVLLVQNHEAMSKKVTFKVDLVFQNFESSKVSLYHVVIISFLLGVVVMGMYGIIEHFRFKRRIKVLTNDLQDQEKELNSLRNLPITSDDVSAHEADSDQGG